MTKLVTNQDEGHVLAIRDISKSLGMKTMLTLIQEKLSLSAGRTKGGLVRPLDFTLLGETLQRAGYSGQERLGASKGTPFANDLLLARK